MIFEFATKFLKHNILDYHFDIQTKVEYAGVGSLT